MTSAAPVPPLDLDDAVADTDVHPDAPFETLDAIFAPSEENGTVSPDPALTYSPNDVTVFVPSTGVGALYLGGILVGHGDNADLLVDALVRTGASVVISADYLLGKPEGDPAATLDEIATYTSDLDRIDSLRAQAQALLDEAVEVESRLAAITDPAADQPDTESD